MGWQIWIQCWSWLLWICLWSWLLWIRLCCCSLQIQWSLRLCCPSYQCWNYCPWIWNPCHSRNQRSIRLCCQRTICLLTPLELSILPRERPRLNQRLMLMLSMEIMDMVLVTLLDTALATPDPSMEDTLPSPDPLFPAMLLLLLPDMLVLDSPEPSMEDTEVDTTEREKLRLNQRLMLMLSMEPME